MSAEAAEDQFSRPFVVVGDKALNTTYRVSYVRNVSSAGGISVAETEPGSDILAVHCLLDFPGAPVGLALELTCIQKLVGRSASWTGREPSSARTGLVVVGPRK